eukprot:m.282349 g.282349  ORF g.282349 m.282349 type:complete len:108 (+) comp40652_c1_seq63:52-375(+)
MPAEARASLPSSYDHLRLLGCQTGTNSTRTVGEKTGAHLFPRENSESSLEAVKLTVSAGDRVEFLQSHPDDPQGKLVFSEDRGWSRGLRALCLPTHLGSVSERTALA